MMNYASESLVFFLGGGVKHANPIWCTKYIKYDYTLTPLYP